MRLRGLAPLLICLLPACSPVPVSGEISSDGTCSGAFDGVALAGPAEGVRVVARPPEKADSAGRHVLVVYCLLSRPGEAPARIDFVKLDAPDTGVLEVGSYVIDREGDQPRSIGVVVTAPEYLDGARTGSPPRERFAWTARPRPRSTPRSRWSSAPAAHAAPEAGLAGGRRRDGALSTAVASRPAIRRRRSP